MECVKRAVYGDNHPLSHMMHDKCHATDDGRYTMCGKKLDAMWFIVKAEKITCSKCRKKLRE